MLDRLSFSACLWVYPGKGGWTFVTLPKDCADQIRFVNGHGKCKAFGMVKVKVQLGSSVWQTTIWPDKTSGSFLLPVKSAVRKKQRVGAGDKVDIDLTLKSPPDL